MKAVSLVIKFVFCYHEIKVVDFFLFTRSYLDDHVMKIVVSWRLLRSST
jgi:hypothetical protein